MKKWAIPGRPQEWVAAILLLAVPWLISPGLVWGSVLGLGITVAVALRRHRVRITWGRVLILVALTLTIGAIYLVDGLALYALSRIEPVPFEIEAKYVPNPDRLLVVDRITLSGQAMELFEEVSADQQEPLAGWQEEPAQLGERVFSRQRDPVEVRAGAFPVFTPNSISVPPVDMAGLSLVPREGSRLTIDTEYYMISRVYPEATRQNTLFGERFIVPLTGESGRVDRVNFEVASGLWRNPLIRAAWDSVSGWIWGVLAALGSLVNESIRNWLIARAKGLLSAFTIRGATSLL